MTKTFTENDLVRFLYNDLNEDDKGAIQQALMTDDDLRNDLERLKLVIKDLDGVKFSPSKRTTDKILEFSRAYNKQSV